MSLQTESLCETGNFDQTRYEFGENMRAPGGGGRRECRLHLRPRYGERTCSVDVRYSLQGADGAPLLVVQGGISANEEVSTCVAADGVGWWNDIVGDGRAIDTRRFRVLAIDWLDRADLAQARAIDSADQADAIAAVLTTLGCRRAHAFVGASYGAMVALAFAARHAERLDHAVVIAGAHRAHPLSTALRNIQREIVRFGCAGGDPAGGLALARKIAMTTYRSDREFAERCTTPPRFGGERFHFAEESWFDAASRRFVARFTPERFLALSESIDLHTVDPERITVPLKLIGIASDRVVPLADLCELQRRCGARATLDVIDSRFGHDAFLKEPAAIGALVGDALQGVSR